MPANPPEDYTAFLAYLDVVGLYFKTAGSPLARKRLQRALEALSPADLERALELARLDREWVERLPDAQKTR